MSDDVERAQTLLAGLRDIRLPVEAAGGAVAELAAAVALGAAAAVVVAGGARLIGRRAGHVPPAPEANPLDALSAFSGDDRRVALLHLIRARDPDRYACLRQRLYRRDGALDLAVLEAEVRGRV
ncbi:hypothetical protein SAMN04488077_101135 [Roseovarius tolerans]|uniref:Uncharacterized protein n=1 Tax=Roseovarius tolerans TaxID=74031 RepID=A0A1H7UFI2_9RHOB|nr:hypothetical protein [Roseovarius tolerans]SEL95822.1 hypothetical protein SAMN04488077_101135 [Roseovarius tolerans]